MFRYLARRLALGVLVVVGVIVLTFVLARVVPGNPALTWAGPHATPVQLAAASRHLGLNRPVFLQIIDYVRGVLGGNWGTSLHTRQPVLSDISTRLPPSLELVAAALILAGLVGVPMGLIAARFSGKLPDFLARVIAVVGVSTPVFWMALILQIVFFKKLALLPVAGEYTPSLDYTSPLTVYTHMPVVDALITANWPVLWSALDHLILPATALALYPMGVIARMVRAQELDVLGETHIQLVRALGFPERAVYYRFAFRPSLHPVLAVTALVSAYSLVGAFLIESIFDWPGIGSYAVDAIQTLDTPAIVGVTLVVAIVYVALNLIVDIAQATIDPRIRLR